MAQRMILTEDAVMDESGAPTVQGVPTYQRRTKAACPPAVGTLVVPRCGGAKEQKEPSSADTIEKGVAADGYKEELGRMPPN